MSIQPRNRARDTPQNLRHKLQHHDQRKRSPQALPHIELTLPPGAGDSADKITKTPPSPALTTTGEYAVKNGPQRQTNGSYKLVQTENVGQSDQVGHNDDGVSTQSVLARPAFEQQAFNLSSGRNQKPPCVLSQVGYEFAQIDPLSHRGCYEFVVQRPEVLSLNPDDFLEEAVRAMLQENQRYARCCISRAVVLKQCSDLSLNGRRDYFKDLENHKSNTGRLFFREFDTVLAAVQTNCSLSKATATMIGRTRASPGGHVEDDVNPQRNRGRLAVHDEVKSPPDLQHFSLAGGNIPNGVQSSLSSLNPVFAASEPDGSRLSSQQLESRAWATGDKLLDSRYRLRSNAKEFFVFGRVFALLWHESAGNKTLAEEEVNRSISRAVVRGRPISYSQGPYNEYIYTSIRRMVVVLQKSGYCLAVPIITYGGRGVMKLGLQPQEIEAHAVIHDAKLRPDIPAAEAALLLKDPIGVDMQQGQTLAPTSRINFGKVHTVEWNLKVMNVGLVNKRSMPKLEAYWKEEAFK